MIRLNTFVIILWSVGVALPGCSAASDVSAQPPNLVVNGGFEQGMDGWQPLWTREPGAGKAFVDETVRHDGARSIRIEHTQSKDWSLEQTVPVGVRPGEIFDLSAWIELDGNGSASLGAAARDALQTVVDWNLGARTIPETKEWRHIQTAFVVPPGVVNLQVRVTGSGPAVTRVDDVILTRRGSLDELRTKGLPAVIEAESDRLHVTFRTADGSFDVRDRRTGREWAQRSGDSPLIVTEAHKDARGGVDVRLLDPVPMHRFDASIRLETGRPECVVSLHGEGPMNDPIAWPAPFSTAAGQLLILPVNEGISYPVDEVALPPMYFPLYSGHGLCMPWYGVVDGDAGWMGLVETADDAAVNIPRRAGLLCEAPQWLAQKGQFGPDRTIRFVFFDQGGYVAMAKRYRDYAIKTGLFRTLAEKRKTTPAVDRLVGAVNVWCWDEDAPGICREMQAAGIKRILWSNARPPDELKALNEMGVLTSRYDIYQDTMNPENFSKLYGTQADWTTAAWQNNDLMIGADGRWVHGWEVKAKDGTMIPCGVLCDRQAVAYAKQRIPADLKTHPYLCRFIDTTTASPWRECYSPEHPMTRSDSKKFKMDLLHYVGDCGLVVGSETGHDAAVPYASYFEGMLSLGPYRVPDAGRDMGRIWDQIPEAVAKFQTGHRYRLPLWELVYHNCVVAQWYWGDYNNKLPGLWDRRDLWNALYGTPPMFMFARQTWKTNQARFVKSYQAAAPIARATGYSEMLSHEWLTPDHSVQQTRFGGGIVVTVNFGDTPYRMTDGVNLPPLGSRVDGMG